MIETSIFDAWIGWHDQFEERDWISVLDEPIHKIAGLFWIPTDYQINPDDYYDYDNLDQDWDCGTILSPHGGTWVYDDNCESLRPFICKISLP